MIQRRQFLQTALAAPAILGGLSALPAAAATTGSTVIEAASETALGDFHIPNYTPGTPGDLNMEFRTGPTVASRFGTGAIADVVAAQAGDSFTVLYVAFNGTDSVASTWTVGAVTQAGATASMSFNGLPATGQAIVGGDQYQGAGLAALIIGATSLGATLRGATTNQLQAAVTRRAATGGAAFGLEVIVRA